MKLKELLALKYRWGLKSGDNRYAEKAYIAGFDKAKELIHNILSPHKPNCHNFECSNCTEASAILFIGDERVKDET